MADDDIYGNKKKYDDFKTNIESYLKQSNDRRRKYWIKYKTNLKYFQQLFKKFEARDTSYIRRLRLLRTFLLINNVLNKDLAKIDRDDIDNVMSASHEINKSVNSKKCFVKDIKFIWKQLFPEEDEKGRVDETLVPYVVRHLSGKIDISKNKMRGDKFKSLDEFEKLVKGFSDDVRMQALLTISLETLGRPQEILGRKIKDVELYDNYAKIYISEHGKEGTGFLRVIESYFYLSKWLNQHPLKDDPEAYLFVNTGRTNQYKQFKPTGANKLIRHRCIKLKLNDKITLYSLKRAGVTFMRLKGKSDLDIQHTARWNSTAQLKTYDLSNQEESFKIELIKRGLVKDKEGLYKEFEPTTKKCFFCETTNGIAEKVCSKCNRPLDREIVEKEIKTKETELDDIKSQMNHMNKILTAISQDKKIKQK